MLVLCVLAFGCGTTTHIGGAKSPDGRAEVKVLFRKPYGGVDGSIRFRLVRSEGATETIQPDTYDHFPTVVEVVWLPNSRVFGAMELDGLGNDLFYAYDLDKRSQVDFSVVNSTLRKSLIKRFGLEQEALAQSSFDPIDWIYDAILDERIPVLWKSLFPEHARVRGSGTSGRRKDG